MNHLITPVNIPNTDLEAKADEYEKTYSQIGDLEAQVSQLEADAREWLRSHSFGVNNDVVNGHLVDQFDKIRIMTKCFECDKEKEDVELTKTLRDEYADLIKPIISTRIELSKVRGHLSDIKSYITFLKEIGTLAPKPEGKGGKGQQAPQPEKSE